MKKHQLQVKTQCRPQSEQQALEILKLADQQGLISISTNSHTRSVLNGNCSFDKDDLCVSYGDGLVHAFSGGDCTTIPTDEFIARLKGEWVEPEPQPKPIGLSKETKILLSVLLRREFDSLPWYSVEEAGPVIIKAASELELNKLVKEMRSDLNFDIKNTK